jgi:hypothetical protein
MAIESHEVLERLLEIGTGISLPDTSDAEMALEAAV